MNHKIYILDYDPYYVFSTKKSRSTLNEKIAGKNTWEKFVEFWEFFDIIGSRLLC